MSGAYTVAGLLFALEAVGVAVEVNAAGDGLRVKSDARPPADLLEAVRQLKPDILAHLKGHNPAKEETGFKAVPDGSPVLGSEEKPGGAAAYAVPEVSPDLASKKQPALQTETVKPSGPARPLPDWEEIAAQPGRCGSCARAVDASEEWGRYMVTCTCDAAAWWPMLEPFALHIGARCGAYLKEGEEVGRGWRAKGNSKAWGPLSPSPVILPGQTDGQGAA